MCYVIKSKSSVLVTENKGDHAPLFTGSRRECMEWASKFFASRAKPQQQELPVTPEQLSVKAQQANIKASLAQIAKTVRTAKKGSKQWEYAVSQLERYSQPTND